MSSEVPSKIPDTKKQKVTPMNKEEALATGKALVEQAKDQLSPDKSKQVKPKESPESKSKKFWSNFESFVKKASKSEVQKKLLEELDVNPNEFYRNLDKIPDEFFDEIFITKTIEMSTIFPVYLVEKWKNKSFAEKMLKKICKKSHYRDRFIDIMSAKIINEPYAKKFLLDVAENNPRFILREFIIYKDQPYGDRLLKIAIKKHIDFDFQFKDETKSIIKIERRLAIVLSVYHHFSNKLYARRVLRKLKKKYVELMMNNFRGKDEDKKKELKYVEEKYERLLREAKIYVEYYNKDNIRERVEHLNSVATQINPKFNKQLDEFNKKNGLSLRLMGMKGEQYKPLVFVNTGTSSGDLYKVPIRLCLGYEEIEEDRFEGSLQYELQQEYLINEAQIDIWKKRKFDFDFPKNRKTDFMLSAVPTYLTGIETDSMQISQIFQKRYGAHWESVLMENEEKWNSLVPRLGKDVPKNIEPTKKNILAQFEQGLKNAIDAGKQRFVFYYLMHGLEDGTMGAVDGEFSAKEFTKILAKKYKGKPIAAQIEVDIIAESCYSGSQLNAMIDDLQIQKVPVKGLRVITAASHETSAYAGLTPDTAALIGNEIINDRSGAMSYYIAYYFEMIDYLKGQGQKIKPPLGTMGHAIAFADRMANAEMGYQQDLQAYYYSTMDKELSEPEPVEGKREEQVKSTKEEKEQVKLTEEEEEEKSILGHEEKKESAPKIDDEKEEEKPKPSGYYISKKGESDQDVMPA